MNVVHGLVCGSPKNGIRDAREAGLLTDNATVAALANEGIKRIAAAEGRTESGVLREALGQYLATKRALDDSWDALVGSIEGGGGDGLHTSGCGCVPNDSGAPAGCYEG